jgi:hypothetical protein
VTSAINTPRILLAATLLTTCLTLQRVAQSEKGSGASGNANADSLVPLPITEACRAQDKPPCVVETRHLREPDGSNVTKIMLAFPLPEFRTNAHGQTYHAITNLIFPVKPDYVAPTGLTALPSGGSMVLPPDTETRGPACLISVEKLKPSRSKPRSPRPIYPLITITEPTEELTSQPLIDIRGACDRSLRNVGYEVVNAVGQQQHLYGYVFDSYFDTGLWETTTNYFECLDVSLAQGTNVVSVSCVDMVGHRVTTNLVYVLRFDQDKSPPRISIQWPTPGRQVSGEFFTVRGAIDDTTAHVIAIISADGRTHRAEGIVGRDGKFSVEQLPLLGKTNLLTLIATDAAGNSATSTVPVIKSDATLIVDAVPRDQLRQLQVTVTGKVDPPDQSVWLNGWPATVKSDGTWVATGVPLDLDGVAVFEAVAVPTPSSVRLLPTKIAPDSTLPQGSLSVQASLGAQSVILNASRPTYGAFHLHLTGTEGRSYTLFASTNLVDWLPFLTNRNSGATFDYSDTNVTAYGCRFFRVIPLD